MKARVKALTQIRGVPNEPTDWKLAHDTSGGSVRRTSSAVQRKRKTEADLYREIIRALSRLT